MSLIYIDKIPATYRAAFEAKVRDIASKLAIKPEWLMVVMNTESGMDWKIINIGCKNRGGTVDTCGTGLIQFMPKTAIGLKTTTRALQAMSPIQQLDYVYNYFKPNANKITSFYDLYLYTFYPYAAGKPNTYIIGSEISMDNAKTIAAQNKPLDMNGDGVISIADYKAFINKKIGDTGIDAEVDTTTKIAKTSKRYWWGFPLGALLGFGIWKLYDYYK